jgi:hypothetical protein
MIINLSSQTFLATSAMYVAIRTMIPILSIICIILLIEVPFRANITSLPNDKLRPAAEKVDNRSEGAQSLDR